SANNAAALGATAAGTTVQAGATLGATFFGTSSEPLTITGNGAITGFLQGALFAESGNADFSALVTLAGNTTIGAFIDNSGGGNNGGGILTLSGVIAGTGNLSINGGVTFAGSAPNTYNGVTQVNAGVLTLNKSANTNAVPGALIMGDTTQGT